MRYELQLAQVSDDDLLLRLRSLLEDSRRTEGDLVAHIGEVDARRLYAREASPSMHVYCTQVLHLSEAEAYLRITAARAARVYPSILEMLTDGRLHLSGISRLTPHLTPGNHADLLARATHKTRRQVEELVAELDPRPDAPTVIRKLPVTAPPEALRPALETQEVSVALASLDSISELCPDRAGSSVTSTPARVEPLAPERYKVQFTASAALRDKLERLQQLMRAQVPSGDLAEVLDRVVSEKLERLESRRFAVTRSPGKGGPPDMTRPSRYIPAAIRRAVYARDGGRCRYTDRQGRRCPERHRLQLHHRHPYGLGGDRSLDNICLFCPAHSQHEAERDYGRAAIARHRRAERPTRDVGRRDQEGVSSIQPSK